MKVKYLHGREKGALSPFSEVRKVQKVLNFTQWGVQTPFSHGTILILETHIYAYDNLLSHDYNVLRSFRSIFPFFIEGFVHS